MVANKHMTRTHKHAARSKTADERNENKHLQFITLIKFITLTDTHTQTLSAHTHAPGLEIGARGRGLGIVLHAQRMQRRVESHKGLNQRTLGAGRVAIAGMG
jgi:hypothetical protein